MSTSIAIIEVINKQSKAAKNSWSLSIEKYNARLEATIIGIEQEAKLITESKENGSNLFTVINFIENSSLSNNRLCTILYILKLNIVAKTKNVLSVQKFLFYHFLN